MHKNRLWLVFLGIIGICTLWYSVSGILAVQHYRAMSATTPLVDSQWSVEEMPGDVFVPLVGYHYKIGGRIYTGETLLYDEGSRNPSATEDNIQSLRKLSWVAFYDPRQPQRSTLQKSFPIKECLSAVVLLGVFTYLVWLGYSIGAGRS